MKATGIVRRIDDLGRIVIPKEIRRTIRVREGDPLEIFVGREGEVILKKYSPIGELGDFAKEYADSLNETTGHISMIADRDVVIAVSGANKREFLTKPIGKAVEEILEGKIALITDNIQASDGEDFHVIQMDGGEYPIKSQVIAPIVAQGESIGAVIIASKEARPKLGDLEIKLAETAARFLAKQME